MSDTLRYFFTNWVSVERAGKRKERALSVCTGAESFSQGVKWETGTCQDSWGKELCISVNR